MAIIPTCVLTSVIDEVLTPCEWFHTVRAYDIQMKIEIQFTFRKIIIISTEWIFGNQMEWDEWKQTHCKISIFLGLKIQSKMFIPRKYPDFFIELFGQRTRDYDDNDFDLEGTWRVSSGANILRIRK